MCVSFLCSGQEGTEYAGKRRREMIINYLHKIGWFVGLVLLQVLILNNVHIVGYATPFYIYI